MSIVLREATEGFVDEPTAPPRSERMGPSRPCEECGYDLRGLAAGRRCPECGHAGTGEWTFPRPDLLWPRTVAAGLALLVGVTLYATCSVLVQPFSDDLGGTLPALNVPGPKLWAIPLLQRPIGRSPQWPGVVGTRTALLSLLAVWLVTTPHPHESDSIEGDRRRLVRLLARWGAVLPFGVAFGILLTTQGLWPGELPSYRMVLVTCVELPAAALLYAHLSHLARLAPGHRRRQTFERLRWAVPATIVGGALLMMTGWLLNRASGPPRRPDDIIGPRLLAFAAYGAAAVSCGMVATAAVGSLAASYLAAAFPGLARHGTPARRLLRLPRLSPNRLHEIGVAAGLLLLLAMTVLATDDAPWTVVHDSPSGNLPFFTFPGPRLAAATPFLGRRSNWDPLVSRMTVVALNLLAVWLITLRAPGRPADRLRDLTRWGSVIATGAALAMATAWEAMEGHGGRYLRSGLRVEFFALATVLCQLPPTAMLYACFARIAAAQPNSARLSWWFYRLAVVVPALVVASLLLFLWFRSVWLPRSGPVMLGVSGAFGSLQFCAAVWSAALIAVLAGRLIGARAAGTTDTTVFRTIGGATGPAPDSTNLAKASPE